jgi:DNA-binding transcriptional ArsR family regulator
VKRGTVLRLLLDRPTGGRYTCIVTQLHNETPLTPKLAAACCRPIDGLLDPEWFKALCDPTRVRLLGCLVKCGRPCSVGEIAECCSVDLSVVSRHLQILERAGLLESRKQGRSVSYAVRYGDVCGTLRALADAIEQCRPGDNALTSGEGCCGTC